MAKYSKKLTAAIVELIENDVSITEICNAVGIARKTFYEWKSTNPEFAQMIDHAQERCYEELITLARRTLRENIEGYTVEETTYTYEPVSYDENEMILKKKVVKQKRKEPTIRELNMLIQRSQSKKDKIETKATATKHKKILLNPSNSNEAHILAKFYEKIEKDTHTKVAIKNIT